MIFKILSSTPVYVYLILCYLLLVGIRAAKNRIVSLNRILLSYGVFAYLAISAILKFQLTFSNYILLLSVLILFSFLGWLSIAKKMIKIDQQKKLMALPGSWITLLLVLIIFSSKYYLGFKSYQDPIYIMSLEAKIITISTSSFSLGLILGRLSNYLFRFKFSEHEDLSSKNKALYKS